MKKQIIAALLSLTALAGPACAQDAAARPDADPAMFVVKDEDTTIYLFGTIHALDGKQDWLNDEVKTAFDASQELVLEILTPDPAVVGPKLIPLVTASDGKKLSERLTPEQAKILADELTSVGAPANALDNFDPWFAATQLAQIRLMKKGINPAQGAEAVLTEAAKKAGKTLGEVETFEWQISLFDNLSPELQLAMLTGYIDELEEGDALFDRMAETWSKGDIDALAELMNEAMRETPELARLLLAERNKRWAEWIDTRLDKPGTVFFAVGAGHLGGPDSVQNMLMARGIQTQRVAAQN